MLTKNKQTWTQVISQLLHFREKACEWYSVNNGEGRRHEERGGVQQIIF